MKEIHTKIGKHKVFYKEFGKKKDQTLLILHGWWGSSDSWITFAELLEKQWYHIIVPDLPGFGKTKIREVFTLEKYAEIVEELTQWLWLKDFILWWHSNGWAIATQLMLRKNIKIKKLVLNNSAGIRNDTKRGLKRKILEVVSFLKYIPGYHKIRPYFHKAIWAHDYADSEKNIYLSGSYQNMIQSDLQDIFPQITDRVLLIWWEQDSYTPLSDGRRIHELLPSSELVIIPGEKHGIHLHNPEILQEYFLKQT